MSEPFLGEIRATSFNFPPKGWAFCDGQLLPINQNQALFSLLGTTYGGDGTTNFALPNLQGRASNHMGQGFGGSGFVLGQTGGEETHTLTLAELPAHSHAPAATAAGDTGVPQNAVWAGSVKPSYAAQPNALMREGTLTAAGGSQPHNNLQPYLVLSYIIALQGIFPSQT